MKESIAKVYLNQTLWVNKKNQLHRKNGPAVEYTNGDTEWWSKNKPHREGGPAIELNGDKEWFLYGERHRIDGPAIELANGDKHWYINGEELTEEEFNKKTQLIIK